jgi:FKBP-type peptidyl-prolyl cis-trans isomerase
VRTLPTALLVASGLLLSACGGEVIDTTKPSAAPAASSPAAAATVSPAANPDDFKATGAEQSTPSGLKYIDITPGSGATAATGQSAAVQYTGWLTSGTKFDSSRDRGQPFTFKIGAGEVIKGWDEGVVGMKVGGKRKLLIPYALAYGDAGRPPTIPPKADLVFMVELISVQ